ncbi:MAG: hypothetical protein E6719_00980, partial [Dermabacter sp.]|nr:hypothetical protein [Dermabacter sp.]
MSTQPSLRATSTLPAHHGVIPENRFHPDIAHVVDESRHEPSPQPLETFGIAGGEEVPVRLARRRVQDLFLPGPGVTGPSALLGTRDEGHLVTQDVGDEPGEQRVVGAAQDERVATRGL